MAESMHFLRTVSFPVSVYNSIHGLSMVWNSRKTPFRPWQNIIPSAQNSIHKWASVCMGKCKNTAIRVLQTKMESLKTGWSLFWKKSQVFVFHQQLKKLRESQTGSRHSTRTTATNLRSSGSKPNSRVVLMKFIAALKCITYAKVKHAFWWIYSKHPYRNFEILYIVCDKKYIFK